MKKVAIIAGCAAIALGSAQAADLVLDLTPDPSPDGAVVFTLTVPYALADLHPEAAAFTMRCRISIAMPRNAEATLFDSDQFEAPTQSVDLTAIPVSADGFRDASGELTYVIEIPADKASTMRLEEARSSYRCDAGLDDDRTRPGSIVINDTNTDNLSLPYWGKGESSGHGGGAVSGRLVRPAASTPSEEETTPLTIDRDLVRKKLPLPLGAPRLPKKD